MATNYAQTANNTLVYATTKTTTAMATTFNPHHPHLHHNPQHGNPQPVAVVDGVAAEASEVHPHVQPEFPQYEYQ